MKVLALSLILCWGLHASAETDLKEDALNANELSADSSLGDLEDAFDDGQDELLDREDDILPVDSEAEDELGSLLDSGLSTDVDNSLTASDRWGCNKKCRRRKRRRRRARRARRWEECQRQASRGNPRHITCVKHFRSLRRRSKKCRRFSFKCAFKRNGVFGKMKDAINKSFKRDGLLGMSKDIFNKYICNTNCKCNLLKGYMTAQTGGTATMAVDVACRAYQLHEQVQSYRRRYRRHQRRYGGRRRYRRRRCGRRCRRRLRSWRRRG